MGRRQSMFTVEIGGNPITVTNADEAQARDVFESEEFKQDLMAMTVTAPPCGTEGRR
jgi:hypothetical protein